jgi:hypothetical protein
MRPATRRKRTTSAHDAARATPLRRSRDDVPVEHYTTGRVDNDDPAGEPPWQLHYRVWNAMLAACKRHGRVGPFRRAVIEERDDGPHRWIRGSEESCDFYANPDRMNIERYVYVDVLTLAAITAEWLLDLLRAMRRFPGWGVGVEAWPRAYVLVFGDRLMVTGKAFRGCRSIAGVARRGRAALREVERVRPPTAE